MKRISAIIKPFKLDDVREALADIGIAGGVGEGLLIKHGEIVKRVKQEDMVQTLKDEILKMVEEKSE